MAHLREMLEPDLARLGAERGVPKKTVARLRSLIRTMSKTDLNDRGTHFRLDVEFHRLLADAPGMPMITELVISARVWMSPALQIFATPDRWRTSTEEHRCIVAAIEARDPPGAAEAALHHVHVTTQLIERKLDDLRCAARDR